MSTLSFGDFEQHAQTADLADAKNTGLQEAPRPEVYFPHTVSGTGQRRIKVLGINGKTGLRNNWL
jgi:hypothetical protein